MPATIPPSAGPPRASALPPSPTTDPALTTTVHQTADMNVSPDARGLGVGSTVNIPAVVAMPAHPATVVRRPRGTHWGIYATLATCLLGGAGAFGYYYYDSVYNAPVPPPRPVRHVYTQSAPRETPDSAKTSGNSGPTQVQPLDPEALEETPGGDWQNNPTPVAPNPRPAPRAGGGAPVNTGGSAGNPQNPGSVPIFTLPTAIPLPSGNIPINIPTAFPPLSLPTGFSIPGLTPPPAANSN